MQALLGAAFGALLAATLGAAPAAAVQGLRALEGHAGPAVHQIADRRCGPGQGGRHCRRAKPRRQVESTQKEEGYGYSYGNPRAEFYPTGTTHWWRAMEREGRTAVTPD
jgi:hypothetical protein